MHAPPPSNARIVASSSSPSPTATHQRRQSRDLHQLARERTGFSSPAGNGRTLHQVREDANGDGEEDEDRARIDAEKDDEFLPLPSASSPSSFVVPNHSTPLSRGEHARKPSRIHERNLSTFFPRPGQVGEGYGDAFDDPHGPGHVAGVQDVPSAAGDAFVDDPSGKGKVGRRGHHHKHSVSHNFFSFLDPTQTNPDLSRPSPNSPSSPSSAPFHSTRDAFAATDLPAPSQLLRSKYAHLPGPLRLVVLAALYLPLSTQCALVLSIAQIALGATLWVTGQAGESLATTGLGYLVVFDGMGGLSKVLVEGGRGVDRLWALLGGGKAESVVRLPFGCVPLPPDSSAQVRVDCLTVRATDLDVWLPSRTFRRPSTSSSRPCTFARSPSSTCCCFTAEQKMREHTVQVTEAWGTERAQVSALLRVC